MFVYFLISFMSEICPQQNKALSSGQALKKITLAQKYSYTVGD